MTTEQKHDLDCEQMENFWLCHCAKRERISKGQTELPTLSIQYPICNGCGKETWHDGDSLRCDNCHVVWDTNAGDGDTAAYFWDDHDYRQRDGSMHTLEMDVQAWIEREKRRKQREAVA